MILKTKMMSQQKAGFDYLSGYSIGALHMDTGTGKTRTMLELIHKRYHEHKIERVLWITPVSVKQNLLDDIIKHSDCTVSFYESNKDTFIKILGTETFSQSNKAYQFVLDFVEEYGQRLQLVIDEAHCFKNPNAIRVKRLMPITRKLRYKNELTGTPITQGLWDMYTQMYMLDPRILKYPTFNSFAKVFLTYSDAYPGKIDAMYEKEAFISMVKPYIFQVTKKECLDLPAKTYSDRYFYPFKDANFAYTYNKVKDLMLNKVDPFNPNGMIIFQMLTYLHRLASGDFHKVISDKWGEAHVFDYSSNERLLILKETLESINLNRNKVIIFFKYYTDLAKISDMLDIPYAEFHGALNEKEKQQEMHRFKTDATCNILVSNIQSGSVGLNLQEANYIIYYNNTFDFAKRMQGEDRIYRIGQEKNCFIIDIIADDTIDCRINAAIQQKSSLVKWVRSEMKKVKQAPAYYWPLFKDKLRRL
ncbi:helicase-related protein [Listeria booriae]|uniref:helicase-related protein n=1 Tax=Listeria booriae TaxID=1552123 RepID=UPI001623C549|nr:DEAD/DEAH box helicase [Listeria booriae]MBC2258811.1 DEAD/DEAH box helicase [Listeria booriae]